MARWVDVAVLLLMAQLGSSVEEQDTDLGSDRRPKYYCGYEVTKHRVTSRDGYVTTAFRLPRNEAGVAAGQPVILQHGFLSNSDTWFQLREDSLPCLLADAGYDVWVTNARGNTYSLPLTSATIERGRYWDFSFHEMAVRDLPATIDYICSVTKKENVSYIGHSMGGAMNFILLSTIPKYNKKINVAVTLAPACYVEMNKFLKTILDLCMPIVDFVVKALARQELDQQVTSPSVASARRLTGVFCVPADVSPSDWRYLRRYVRGSKKRPV